MLKVGIVGMPNVGKSTLFKTLTKKQVDCENFPFCTIEPNVGVVEVPDHRLEQLSRVSKSQKTIPTAIEFVDIAGLVRGAHKGEGLGNKFLANIREVDMIVHVVRAFVDENVHHVDGSIDPVRDREIIETELALADIETVEKRLEAARGKMKSGANKALETEWKTYEKAYAALETGAPVSSLALSLEEEEILRPLHLLTNKPILYVVNVAEETLSHPNEQHPIKDGHVLSLCVKLESELIDMPPEEQQEFFAALGITQSGLDAMIQACYGLLHLVTYFTSGEKETRAWTVRDGTKAPQAAGIIHTDFEKGFIRAETIHWKDFVELGEPGAKEAGKLRVEGKEYVVKDGDVMHFRVQA
ncbi:MAG: GTP-binding protein YchF [Parcubacteria group bacterium GW2011_GWA2_56_7]|nr:MAG: GTP-binding protein YchF [Parcubacteria group bacterium GW2011_GWA2_56_7]